MKFENDDYVAAVAWVLQPTQPLKEQTVSCEPLINQTKTGKRRCSFSPKVNCALTFNYGHVTCRLTKNLK